MRKFFSFIKSSDFSGLFIFLVLVLLFFGQFLTGENIFGYKDLSRYFYPLRYLMVEQARAGILPLWNPYIFCGFPLMATLQICFFYPLSLIYYLLPFHLAFNYYIILHYFLAASFMYALLRHYSLSFKACFLGGLIFVFSGYMLSVSNMNTSLSSVIWLPLILLFFDRLMKEKALNNIVILALLLAMQFLGGEPTIIYVSTIFLFAYALVFGDTWKIKIRSILSLASAEIIAASLVAIQLLPFIELTRLSDRVVATAYEIVSFRSFPPRDLITFIFPYFFGNITLFGNYAEVLLGSMQQDWLISVYLGILPLIFIIFAFKKGDKLPIFLGAATLIAFLLAFGKYTPVYKLIYYIPGISMIRFPVKYLFLANFCLCLLTSFGFENLLKILEENRNKLRKILFVLTILLVFIAVFFAVGYVFRMQIFNYLASKYPATTPTCFIDLLARIIEFNLFSFYNILFYLLAFILLSWGVYRKKIGQGIFSILVIAMVAADLMANGYSIVIPVSKIIYDQAPKNIEKVITDNEIYRLFYTPEVENHNRVITGDTYEDALFNTKDNFSANWHIPYHIYDFYGYESIKPIGIYNYYSKLNSVKIEKYIKDLSLFNVKYIATLEKSNLPQLKLLRKKKVFGQYLYLYENKKVLPRAYALDAQRRPDIKGSKVEIIKYSPLEIIIQAKLANDGYLFLLDSCYPGWKAYIDNKEFPILIANDLFRSVKIKRGEHEVKYVYKPLSFKIGSAISLLTIIGMVIVALNKAKV